MLGCFSARSTQGWKSANRKQSLNSWGFILYILDTILAIQRSSMIGLPGHMVAVMISKRIVSLPFTIRAPIAMLAFAPNYSLHTTVHRCYVREFRLSLQRWATKITSMTESRIGEAEFHHATHTLTKGFEPPCFSERRTYKRCGEVEFCRPRQHSANNA